MKGIAFLPTVLLQSAVIVELGIAGALLVYLLNNANLGVRLSAEALAAAQAGIEDGIIRIIRDKNYSTAGYTLTVGSRLATVAVCKDSCAGIGKSLITVKAKAANKFRQLQAVVEVNSITGKIEIQSIKEVALQ